MTASGLPRLFLSLLLLATLLGKNGPSTVVSGFLFSPRRISAIPSCSRASQPTRICSSFDLETRTVQELWQIVEDADMLERGMKTRLKRKQDIIEYIQEHQMQIPHEQQQEGKVQLDDSDQEYRTNREHSESGTNDKTEKDNTEDLVSMEENKNVLFPDIKANIACKIPPFLAQNMIQKGITSLLPIQVESFHRIYSGEDSVLQSPTGSGKTLAYVLPILARKWKGVRQKTAAPSVLVLAPSRELAQQVGKEFSKFGKASSATVYGGVPIERHVALLKKTKPQVLISTPGRLRELVREGHVDYSQIVTLVLDEADSLLDKADSPDVRAIMEDMETAVGYRKEDPEYQLVLVSATINQHVVEFARDLEIPSDALIRVKGSDSKVPVMAPSLETDMDSNHDDNQYTQHRNVPSVQHWHMSCKSSVRPGVLADLISILSPQLTIVFVATKTETESVASYLSNKLGGSIRTLHGDMAQSARSRSISLVREAAEEGVPQILVATDVVSRGIDLSCDLVVQFGVPRIAGKEGTFSTELYTHRTGRTGRARSKRQGSDFEKANAIMLYDPGAGEGKLVPDLVTEVHSELGVSVLPKPLPSSAEVVEAGYMRASEKVSLGTEEHLDTPDLVSYFRSKLESDNAIDTTNPQELLENLARAMAIVSNLDLSVSPFEQHSSLLSGNDADRTLRLYRDGTESLTPPEVTQFCKSLGSGKLGRVLICKDGSAVFDLPLKRVTKLVEASEKTSKAGGWHLELPLSLPRM